MKVHKILKTCIAEESNPWPHAMTCIPTFTITKWQILLLIPPAQPKRRWIACWLVSDVHSWLSSLPAPAMTSPAAACASTLMISLISRKPRYPAKYGFEQTIWCQLAARLLARTCEKQAAAEKNACFSALHAHGSVLFRISTKGLPPALELHWLVLSS